MLNTDANYFEHSADIGVIGRGNTIENAFESAAYNTFAIMADLDNLRPQRKIKLSFIEDDPEFALVKWLNLLLAHAREEGLMLCEFKLIRKDSNWFGEASGEKWRSEHIHGVEVKGATLTMLSVKKNDNMWEARCVVDV